MHKRGGVRPHAQDWSPVKNYKKTFFSTLSPIIGNVNGQRRGRVRSPRPWFGKCSLDNVGTKMKNRARGRRVIRLPSWCVEARHSRLSRPIGPGGVVFLSQASKYGLRAVLYLAKNDAHPSQRNEIAEALQIPTHFLAKLLQNLSKRGLLVSTKGPGGGFKLARPADQISLADVVRAIEGDQFGEGCVLGLPECSNERPCPLHSRWSAIKEDIFSMLGDESLTQLSEEMSASP